MLDGTGDEQGGKTIRRYEGGEKEARDLDVERRKRRKEKAVVWDKVVEEGMAEVKRDCVVTLETKN